MPNKWFNYLLHNLVINKRDNDKTNPLRKNKTQILDKKEVKIYNLQDFSFFSLYMKFPLCPLNPDILVPGPVPPFPTQPISS